MSFPHSLVLPGTLTDDPAMIRYLLVLPLLLGSCSKDETISGYADRQASYALQELDGRRFEAEATIAFPEDGLVTGIGPCNSYSASQSVPYPWFQLGPIQATRRGCADLARESEFFSALEAMTLIEVLGDTVILRNVEGREMMFRAVQP